MSMFSNLQRIANVIQTIYVLLKALEPYMTPAPNPYNNPERRNNPRGNRPPISGTTPHHPLPIAGPHRPKHPRAWR